MSRKQTYTPAQMEVIRFENNDVVITSPQHITVNPSLGCIGDSGGSGGGGITIRGFGQTC